jgi:hypothetical protein
MWEWIALVMGAAFIGLYFYALWSKRAGRDRSRQPNGG